MNINTHEILNIHANIKERLDYFITVKKIPNIIFHGPYGSGKKTIVYSFIDKIYNNDSILKKNYTMFVNCAQGKGIKFIRDELKFFAKTHINYHDGNLFKTVVLSNADKLTIDAQSALRRCIEQFAHTTRFFIIIEDKYRLLKPIISRFSEIFIPLPKLNGNYVNLNKHNIEINTKIDTKTNNEIDKYISSITDYKQLIDVVNKLYENAFTVSDLINYIETKDLTQIPTQDRENDKTLILLIIQKIQKELRSEKMIFLFIINLLIFRSDCNLESIAFI